MTPSPIALARPNISQADIDAVVEVLGGPNLSLGPKLAQFESAMSEFCRTRYAVACSSGTAGLHMLVRAMGIGPGDEVITTPFSFVASANCALMEGARPVFVDILPGTWNIDPQRVAGAVTSRTKALIPVDVFGQVADLDELNDLARRHEIRVIEDSCEALGSRHRGRPAGSLGDAGVFGFYPNKQITTGEGGMIVTDDEELAIRCRSLRNQGRDGLGGWLSHPRMGYNYRLSDINCALGLSQLSRLDQILAERSRVYHLYRDRLAGEPRIVWQEVRHDVEVSWFVLVIRLADRYDGEDRDRILLGLRDRGVGCSNYFVPIHLQPFYVERFGFRRGDYPVCEAVADRTIALPFHHELTASDVDRVGQELIKLL